MPKTYGLRGVRLHVSSEAQILYAGKGSLKFECSDLKALEQASCVYRVMRLAQ